MEPRVRRHRSEEDEEAAPAPEMLSVDGDAAGIRWPRELHGTESTREEEMDLSSICFYVSVRERKINTGI